MTRKSLVYSSRACVWCNPDGTRKTPIEEMPDGHAFVPQSGDVILTFDKDRDRIVRREVIRFTTKPTHEGDIQFAVLGAPSDVLREDTGVLMKAVEMLRAKIGGSDVDFCDLERYFNYCKSLNEDIHESRSKGLPEPIEQPQAGESVRQRM